MVPGAPPVTGVVVSDASPLLSFARAGELGLLRALVPEIAIPPAVYEEIVTRGAGRAGAAEVAAGDWVRVHPVTLPFADISSDLGEGERQAMALARELGSQLLIDERFGRREAHRLGLVTLSTLSLLEEAKLSGVIQAAKPVLDRLLAQGYRLSQRLYREFLDGVGE